MKRRKMVIERFNSLKASFEGVRENITELLRTSENAVRKLKNLEEASKWKSYPIKFTELVEMWHSLRSQAEKMPYVNFSPPLDLFWDNLQTLGKQKSNKTIYCSPPMEIKFSLPSKFPSDEKCSIISQSFSQFLDRFLELEKYVKETQELKKCAKDDVEEIELKIEEMEKELSNLNSRIKSLRDIAGRYLDDMEAFEEILMKLKGYTNYKGKWGTPEQVEEWKKIDIGMQNNFEGLSPREFEKLVADLFTAMGFETRLTPYVKDFGADIIAERETEGRRERILIQAKRYSKGHLVGAPEVQRTLGSIWKYKADRSILVTNSDFTIEAREQAKEAPIELWNRETLYRMIDKYILSGGLTQTEENKKKSYYKSSCIQKLVEEEKRAEIEDKEDRNRLSKCDACGKEVPNVEILKCGECGKKYCNDCAHKWPKTIVELGVCPDCEETYEAEEDYWRWGEEEEW